MDGKLKFEGEYLYDKIKKGKEYNNYKLIFEGEYLNGKKWNGIEYDDNAKNKIKNGKGIIRKYQYLFYYENIYYIL